MVQPVSTTQEIQAALVTRRTVPAIAAGGTVLLIGTLALWFHYGTAVFFETIVSGLNACL